LMDLEGEYQAELARLDARVASMSTAELRAIVGEPWSSLGEEALRKRAKVVLKDRLDAWRRVQERVIRLSTEMAVDHLDRRMAQVQAELALEAERIQDSPLGLPTDQSFAYRQNLLQLKARVQEMEDSGLLDRGTLEGLKKALVDAEKQAQALDRLRTQWNRLQTSFLKENLTGEAQAEEVLAFVRQVKE
ncbi:hypothetical protein, partial [Thermus sp.]|uniref:hypothetical protein n=1 Tax=Thermus sp. TaxID=275 RepID=UPI00260C132A